MKVTVLDTCCLINLFASQRPRELIENLDMEIIIPKEVAKESLFIRQPSDDDPELLIPEEISLDAFEKDSTIKVVGFDGDEELDRFIHFAVELDDGEAACLAIAYSRGLCIATDERKAIRFSKDLGIEVLTTPEILKNWVDVVSPKHKEIAEIIQNIELYGRFRPHPTSDHLKWWEDNGPNAPGCACGKA